MLTTEMAVPVRPGQREKLLEKLAQMWQANRHVLPGTIARYIAPADSEMEMLHFLFVWKDSEMPDEATRQQHLGALQEEFADVLDWEQASSSTNRIVGTPPETVCLCQTPAFCQAVQCF